MLCRRPDNGALLMVLQAEPGETLTWALPGGAIEPGETLAQAAVREAKEETGLEVQLLRAHLKVRGVYDTGSQAFSYHIYYFEATVVGGTLSQTTRMAPSTRRFGWSASACAICSSLTRISARFCFDMWRRHASNFVCGADRGCRPGAVRQRVGARVAARDRHRTEFAVTWRVLAEHLPPPPARILDCGGGPDTMSSSWRGRATKSPCLTC